MEGQLVVSLSLCSRFRGSDGVLRQIDALMFIESRTNTHTHTHTRTRTQRFVLKTTFGI